MASTIQRGTLPKHTRPGRAVLIEGSRAGVRACANICAQGIPDQITYKLQDIGAGCANGRVAK